VSTCSVSPTSQPTTVTTSTSRHANPRTSSPASGTKLPRRSVGDPNPGLLVLHDLRTLYLMASENSLHWEMLAQAAQASRDTSLLDLATACHPQTLRQIRWANTLIKSMSPQILTSLTSQ